MIKLQSFWEQTFKNNTILMLLRIKFSLILTLILSFTIHLSLVNAQSNLSGVLQNYLAVQTSGDHEFIASRNRLRIRFKKSLDFGDLNTEADLIHRFEDFDEPELFLKEAYFNWFFSDYDLSIGHQKIIWGRSNGTIITDIITPYDLREFLTVSAENIRFGITSLNVIRYFGNNSLQLVMAPFFQGDRLPSAESRWFPAPNVMGPFSSLDVKSRREDSAPTLSDIQIALRYSLFSPERLDLDLFLMRWTHPTPAYNLSFNSNPDGDPAVSLIESYQSSLMAGFSSSLKITNSLFFLSEGLFVKDKLFTNLPFNPEMLPDDITADSTAISKLLQILTNSDSNFLVSKPWLQTMVGFRTEFLKTTIDAQFFAEAIFNYDDEILQDKIYTYTTLLLTRSLARDRLQTIALARYNIDKKYFWFQLQGRYELDNNVYLTLGTNLFGGKKTDTFNGQISFSEYRDNSFIFSKIALFF